MIAALFVLAGNTLLRPLANRINRQPVKEGLSEATYGVYVICARDVQVEMREKLVQLREAADYPVRAVAHRAFGQTDSEIGATLFATAVEAAQIDGVVAALEAEPGVLQAFWNASAED